MPPGTFTRRQFVGRTAALAAGVGLGLARSIAQPQDSLAAPPPTTSARRPGSPPPLLGFAKPFQHLEAEVCADLTADLGWDGLEIPVRARDVITPTTVAEKLPPLIEALRRRGCLVNTIATDLRSLNQPHAESTLRTIAGLGLKHVRLGFWKYDATRHPLTQLAEIAPHVRDLAQACGALGLQAGIENHSGPTYVGAPVWDIHELIRELPASHIGVCFDIGHATIEGGRSWSLHARLLTGRFSTVIVKDFSWIRTDTVWKPQWCLLGDGMVSPQFFRDLVAGGYSGPIIQHHEYELSELPGMKVSFQRDLATLRRLLSAS